MTETIEREQYRMRCKHYGIEGHCRKQSREISNYGSVWAFPYTRMFVDVVCTSDANCERMKRYDKNARI